MDLAEETAEMLGRLPRRIRTAHIAEATGLCKVWLSRFENGGHPQPNLDKVRRLHAFLRTHLQPEGGHRKPAVDAAPRATPAQNKPKATAPAPKPNHTGITRAENVPLTYTVAETTRRLGVSQRLVYRMLAEGALRRVKVGRRTLIPAEAVHLLAGCE